MDEQTKKMLQEILTAVQGLDARITRVETGAAHTSTENADSPRTATRRQSIKEFMLGCRPTDDVQKTLAVGYFLETQEGMASFNKADLERGFRNAKEQVPGNINDKVNMSIKNGHMMEAETKKESMKAWVITGTGEQYLKNGFKKEQKGK